MRPPGLRTYWLMSPWDALEHPPHPNPRNREEPEEDPASETLKRMEEEEEEEGKEDPFSSVSSWVQEDVCANREDVPSQEE